MNKPITPSESLAMQELAADILDTLISCQLAPDRQVTVISTIHINLLIQLSGNPENAAGVLRIIADGLEKAPSSTKASTH